MSHSAPLVAGTKVTPMGEPEPSCDHGIVFDEEKAKSLDVCAIRKAYPRLHGPCPKGCGFSGIGYASFKHYLYGDW